MKIINVVITAEGEFCLIFEDNSVKRFQDYLDEHIEKKLESLGLLQEKNSNE